MMAKGIGISFILLLIAVFNSCEASRLNHFNKIPVTTVKSKDGSVIDCMDVDHLPFDYPLLENLDLPASSTGLWPSDDVEGCPDGTVPVVRSSEGENMIASSIHQGFGMMSSPDLAPNNNDFNSSSGFAQFAVMFDGEGEHLHFGAKAVMNIWEPHVEPHEATTSFLTLSAGSDPELINAIGVGWHVIPDLYGDNRSRFFVTWTNAKTSINLLATSTYTKPSTCRNVWLAQRDSFRSTGCLNLRCPGFVQTTNKITLGKPFPLHSSLNAAQFEISILIWKAYDAWWIKVNDITLGHWSDSLFTDLAKNATFVGWGGSVFHPPSDGRRNTETQMGSGHFPEEGFRRASYMRQLHVVNETRGLHCLRSPRTLVKEPNCYNISVGNNGYWGNFIFYGGPGRNLKCP